MAVSLEDFDATLNATTLDLLGDTITYRPGGGAALPAFKAIVDHGDQAAQLSGSRVTLDDCAVEVPVAIVAEPAGADIIELPKRPGQQFQPRNYLLDESGDNWLIVLKRKPA